MNNDSFKEYIKQIEPSKYEKAYAWHTAIGLQAVDGLETSDYLKEIAIKNIEGELTLDEVQTLLKQYYKERPENDSIERKEEADMVSSRIAELIEERAFSCTAEDYTGIHRRLFEEIFDSAGKIRDYNISKKEWVLDGESILYGTATELRATLEYDLSEERKFSYRNLSTEEVIHHLATFIARLWQIHVFGEGNTRTTAVFFIKYLRKLGYDVNNDSFAENAWYFRNALVRANYTNLTKGIYETTEYLELFLQNLLQGKKNELHNRTLHISKALDESLKANIGDEKANIGDEKANIGDEKANIQKKLLNLEDTFTNKTINYILELYKFIGSEDVFGRGEVEKITGLKSTRAHELIEIMSKAEITEEIKGKGKGKYRFK